jgi:hypothetical protein
MIPQMKRAAIPAPRYYIKNMALFIFFWGNKCKYNDLIKMNVRSNDPKYVGHHQSFAPSQSF